MGTKFWEVVCDEHGIGGDGEYCGGNDAQLARIGKATRPKAVNVPRAMLFDLESSVANVVRA
jgi:tubulin beta